MFLGIYFFLSCPIGWCIIFKQVPESESLYYFCMKRFLCQLTKQPSWLEHGGNNTKDVGSVPIWASASLLLLTHWIILLQSSNKLEITSQTSTWEWMLTSFVLQQWHSLPSPPPLPLANTVPAKKWNFSISDLAKGHFHHSLLEIQSRCSFKEGAVLVRHHPFERADDWYFLGRGLG